MKPAYDLVIRKGTVYNGVEESPIDADLAIKDGLIVDIGKIRARGRQEINAAHKLVTPGFVDIHTHYDGQAVWSQRLQPSSDHGVTSVIGGNCGVGFAPCRTADHDVLIDTMEGVEDIPEVVMKKGLPWTWEKFPEYLDELESRSRDIDIGVYVPHSPLRVYVMGDRGVNREVATTDDLEHMAQIVDESMRAGAMGFATSRLMFHRTGKGEAIPSFDADIRELEAISSAVGRTGEGIIQLIANFLPDNYEHEMEIVQKLAEVSGRHVSFSLGQQHQMPDFWRDILSIVSTANGRPGISISAQVFPRPIGMLVGHDTSVNPFSLCPTYEQLSKLPLSERVVELRRTDLREKLLSELPSEESNPLYLMSRNFGDMYPLGDPPDYEPGPGSSIEAQAQQRGISPEEMAYDILLEKEGNAMLYLAFANYQHKNLEAVLEMLKDPNTVIGLGDGGAHYGLICDSSYPTSLLTHWTRDRQGERISIGFAIKSLTSSPASTVGLSDRGSLEVGKKADVNIIDYDRLVLHHPYVLHDLPSGGRRLLQKADGYSATIVNGEVICNDGVATGALPGRLIRGGAYERGSTH